MSLFVSEEGIPVGRAVYSTLSSAVELVDTPATGGDTLPATADSALIIVSGQSVHMETDGTAATTDQPKLPTGTYWFENQRTLLSKVSFLESAASGRLDIWYFSTGRK